MSCQIEAFQKYIALRQTYDDDHTKLRDAEYRIFFNPCPLEFARAIAPEFYAYLLDCVARDKRADVADTQWVIAELLDMESQRLDWDKDRPVICAGLKLAALSASKPELARSVSVDQMKRLTDRELASRLREYPDILQLMRPNNAICWEFRVCHIEFWLEEIACNAHRMTRGQCGLIGDELIDADDVSMFVAKAPRLVVPVMSVNANNVRELLLEESRYANDGSMWLDFQGQDIRMPSMKPQVQSLVQAFKGAGERCLCRRGASPVVAKHILKFVV